MEILATYGPCCHILREGDVSAGTVHDGGCKSRNGGDLGPTIRLVNADLIEQQAAEIERLRAENQALHKEAGQAMHDRGLMKLQLDRAEDDNERLRADVERYREALLKEAAGLERAATGMHDKPHRLSAWKDEEWRAYGPERLLLTAARMRQAARGE